MYSTTWNPKTAIYIACKIPHLTKNDETAIKNQCIFNSFVSNQIIIDGSENSIKTSINILNEFSKISGLK